MVSAIERAGAMLRAARKRAGLSQRDLAAVAGTSGPTIAAYESSTKEPRIGTLERLLAATGAELCLVCVDQTPESSLSREARRSLALHTRILDRLLDDPEAVLAKARHNLRVMRRAHPDGSVDRWFDLWEIVLDGPLDLLAGVLMSPAHVAVELRAVTPFAGVLTPQERWTVFRRFREEERRAS